MSDVLIGRAVSHAPRKLLLGAYKQWIDLARERNDPEIWRLNNESPLPRDYLWKDDDNPETGDQLVSPILAGESLLSFLLPLLSIDEYSPFGVRRSSEDYDDDINDIREITKYLSYTPDEPDIKPPPIDQPLSERHFIAIFEVISRYYELTMTSDGAYRCTGGSYFTFSETAEPRGSELEKATVVDAFSMGLSVSLRVLFLTHKVLSLDPPASDDSDKLKDLCRRAERNAKGQLKICLAGLERSFVVAHVANERWEALEDGRYTWDDLASLPEIQHIEEQLIGLGHASVKPNRHFECGWTWGSIHSEQHEGAENSLPEGAPYLYFTWTALAAIGDLTDERLQIEALLDYEDYPAVTRLKRLAELTINYWSLLAAQIDKRTGRARVLSVPWITTDGDRSPYYTLYVLGIIYGNLSLRTLPISATLETLEELAQRARITTRFLFEHGRSEEVVRDLHRPGKYLNLGLKSKMRDGKNRIYSKWRIYDYSPLLLKVCAQVRYETSTYGDRNRVNQLIDALLRHLELRQLQPINLGLTGDPGDDQNTVQAAFEQRYGIWDNFAKFDKSTEQAQTRNWYFTQRVIEALVTCIVLRPRRINLPTVEALVQEMIVYLDDRTNIASELRSMAKESPVDALSLILENLKGHSK